MLNYRWPGNIRELKNVVERSVYRHGTSDYPLDDIIIDPFKRRPPEDAIAVSETTSLPTLPLDLREFQMQQEKELLRVVEKAPDLAKLSNTTCRMRRECFIRHT